MISTGLRIFGRRSSLSITRGKERLTDVRRHEHVVAQHQVRILNGGLSSEEHSYEVPEIAHAFLRLRGEQTRCRCERLRSQNGHRIGTAEFRKGADKVKGTDVFVAVVPNVVEGTSPYDQEQSIG